MNLKIEYLNSHLTKEDIWITNKLVWKGSAALVVEDMQTKTTVSSSLYQECEMWPHWYIVFWCFLEIKQTSYDSAIHLPGVY
jgi:hypothetical protein